MVYAKILNSSRAGAAGGKRKNNRNQSDAHVTSVLPTTYIYRTCRKRYAKRTFYEKTTADFKREKFLLACIYFVNRKRRVGTRVTEKKNKTKIKSFSVKPVAHSQTNFNDRRLQYILRSRDADDDGGLSVTAMIDEPDVGVFAAGLPARGRGVRAPPPPSPPHRLPRRRRLQVAAPVGHHTITRVPVVANLRVGPGEGRARKTKRDFKTTTVL